jgi:hypothetical protein
MTQSPPISRPAFGTVLAPTMALATFRDGAWSPYQIRPVGPVELHPAAHVLHYSSTCFEGFKAYRWSDGSINVFRLDRHIDRMRQSARALVLPEPDPQQLAEMVRYPRLPGRCTCGPSCSVPHPISARPQRLPTRHSSSCSPAPSGIILPAG